MEMIADWVNKYLDMWATESHLMIPLHIGGLVLLGAGLLYYFLSK